ncbi:hypothetical protein SETIT_6G127200v2 [Setaria italica]|uniref:Uncharacterized protein n=1 Tax=Setaria italica TaxID=4555 RepID=A0A368RKV2_SETIT|nr:hypothetical protein SETIT_6G127200v2 [Setaria italica]
MNETTRRQRARPSCCLTVIAPPSEPIRHLQLRGKRFAPHAKEASSFASAPRRFACYANGLPRRRGANREANGREIFLIINDDEFVAMDEYTLPHPTIRMHARSKLANPASAAPLGEFSADAVGKMNMLG